MGCARPLPALPRMHAPMRARPCSLYTMFLPITVHLRGLGRWLRQGLVGQRLVSPGHLERPAYVAMHLCQKAPEH